MNKNYARDLFHLQSDLIDMKVDAVVSKTIDRVVEQMGALRNDMHLGFNQIDTKFHDLRHDMDGRFHDLRHEMAQGFTSLDKRIVAVETRLGIVGAIRKGFYDRFMDYLFKGSYAALYALVLAYLAYQFHPFIK